MPLQGQELRQSKKRVREDTYCAGACLPIYGAQLPTIKVNLSGLTVTAMIDSGCSKSIINQVIVNHAKWMPRNSTILMANGDSMECNYCCDCEIDYDNKRFILNCIVSKVLPGYDLILGMDAIQAMGGVVIQHDAKPIFPAQNSTREYHIVQVMEETLEANVVKTPQAKDFQGHQTVKEDLKIEDHDFTATFSNGHWTVQWKWTDSEPTLHNSVAQYSIPTDIQDSYHEEVQQWIKNQWLIPFDGVCNGIVPLMAIVQSNKSKVRPVLDYRELNQFVSSHTATSDVCHEKLRRWRTLGSNVSLVDLRKAYLQIRVHPDLWRFQVVQYNGKRFCLTRLGFGLNVAPKVMTSIVNKVLSINPRINEGCDAYIDDIIVNENVVSSSEVIKHLESYGLESKAAVPIESARVLGLKVYMPVRGGELKWKRDNGIEPLSNSATKRDVFSFCGKLLGHFPVASWLRPMCGYVKRCASQGNWNSPVDEKVKRLAEDMWQRLQLEDPVAGSWCVSLLEPVVVWTDASSLALGVCIDVGGTVVEDGTWLRRTDDASHINVAELEAVLKGVKMAVDWKIRSFKLCTDSASVFSWLNAAISQKNRTHTHGLSELLIRRRINLIKDIILEYQLEVRLQLVKSSENKADRLTRVPREWLSSAPDTVLAMAIQSNRSEEIQTVHEQFHFGINKTAFIANQKYPTRKFSRAEVQKVVNKCERCRSIDPAPVKFDPGKLEVSENWKRLAGDITHMNGQCYFTFIDCGPSRFAVWKQLSEESLSRVIEGALEVFRERGPPQELLLDNAASFKSQKFVEACNRWGVNLIYRSAFRPECNGIIERHHRTIKRSAARSGCSVLDIVFWYNSSPLQAMQTSSVPSRSIYKYEWRYPELKNGSEYCRDSGPYRPGDRVYVKPGNARCTTEWNQGTVSRITPEGAVEVDGVHRHVGDIRLVGAVNHEASEDEQSDEASEDEQSNEETEVRRSGRIRAQPYRFDGADYM